MNSRISAASSLETLPFDHGVFNPFPPPLFLPPPFHPLLLTLPLVPAGPERGGSVEEPNLGKSRLTQPPRAESESCVRKARASGRNRRVLLIMFWYVNFSRGSRRGLDKMLYLRKLSRGKASAGNYEKRGSSACGPTLDITF